MPRVRGDGASGGHRTLIGARIDGYLKRAGFSQKQLADALGVSPPKLNDMLAGRRALGTETLKAVVGVLRNCTLSDLCDEGVVLKWWGVQKRFEAAFGDLVDKPWHYFEKPRWPKDLPEECLENAIDCFRLLLQEVRAFDLSVDSIGISRTLDESIVFLERAHLKRVPHAGQLLFEMCERLVHCLSYSLLPVDLKRTADPYLNKMRRVFEETHDRALGRQLSVREGDVLKICSGDDTSALVRADEVLQRGLLLGALQDRTYEYETIRDRVFVGSKTAQTERDFSSLLQMAEQFLDSGVTTAAQRLVLEGMGEACAYYFSKTHNNTYRKNAIAYYRRAMALGIPPTPSEIILRLKRLPPKYAIYGIPDLISNDGSEVEELKTLARLAGNIRVAHQADVFDAELRRRKIIKS